MDIKQIKEEGLKRFFSAKISKEDISKKEVEELAIIAKKADIKGFRKGKVPIEIIKKNYKQSVLVRVFKNLIKECLSKIYSEYKVAPVNEPSIEISRGDIMKNEDVEVSLNFEVYPYIPEINLSDISLTKTVLKLSDSDVNNFLSQLSKHYTDYKDIEEDRASKKGDIVVIDFLGKIDNVAFQGGEAKDYPLELGSNTFIPGFEDQLLGYKAGSEITVNVKFPEDYNAKNLADKNATFDVKIKKIQIKEDGRIEDLPVKLGIKDLETLKEDIKTRHIKQYDQILRNDLKNQLVEELYNRLEFELPISLVEAELKHLNVSYDHYKEHKKEAEKKGNSPQPNQLYDYKTEEQILEENNTRAYKRIKLSLIFNKIAEINNIQILPEEVEQAIIYEASKYKDQQSMVVNYYKSNPNASMQIKNKILEDKILDFIFSQIKYVEQERSLDEYNKSLENISNKI